MTLTTARLRVTVGKIGLLLVLTIMTAGCWDRVSREEVIGHYRANYGQRDETLDLLADGTYVHIFKQPDGKTTVKREGRWRFNQNERDGEVRVILFDFAGYQGTRKPRASGEPKGLNSWTLYIWRGWFGGLGLPVGADPDDGDRLEKE